MLRIVRERVNGGLGIVLDAMSGASGPRLKSRQYDRGHQYCCILSKKVIIGKKKELRPIRQACDGLTSTGGLRFVRVDPTAERCTSILLLLLLHG